MYILRSAGFISLFIFQESIQALGDIGQPLGS